MSLSRTESRRRLPNLSISRALAAVFAVLVLAALAAVLYVRSAESGYRGEEAQAIRLAKTEGGLVRVDRAVTYTWDETLWIVIGKDRDGQTWYVWERAGGLDKIKASDGLSESRIRERFASERPAAGAIRVLPGWFAGQPVWEIRYRKSPRSTLQGIDFYSFRDGTLIKSYDLPGQ